MVGGPDYNYDGDLYRAKYNGEDGTVEVETFYQSDEIVRFGGALVIPDFIVKWLLGIERPY